MLMNSGVEVNKMFADGHAAKKVSSVYCGGEGGGENTRNWKRDGEDFPFADLKREFDQGERGNIN